MNKQPDTFYNQSISSKKLGVSSNSPRNATSLYSSSWTDNTSTTHCLNFQGRKKNFHHLHATTRESELSISSENELDVIHSLEFQLYLTETIKRFQAGCIKSHFIKLAKYNMDQEILGLVSDLSFKFFKSKILHYHKGMEIKISSKEELLLPDEIKNLLQKGIIKGSKHKEGEFISRFFLVSKSVDSFKMILSLKKLKNNMPYIQFKMKTRKS